MFHGLDPASHMGRPQRSLDAFVCVVRSPLQNPDVSAGFSSRSISKMLEGADVEADDANSPARNTQFELYVAAVLGSAPIRKRIAAEDMPPRHRATPVRR